jgi:RNA polymerase sigma factor (sigma-70 family)
MVDPTPEVVSSGPQLASSIFRKYKAELHRWLARRLKNPDAADDVAQEVFARLSRVEKVAYVRKPLAYVFGIAFHVISELQIKEEQDRVVSYNSDEVDRLGETPQYASPDEFVDRLNLQRQLEKAFAQLPPHYQTVLLLCKRDGMSYEEAAAASGLSVHTVEKYLVRARARMMAIAWDL